jgi:hypothetical protein
MEVLRNAGKLPKDESAEITTIPLRLPSGKLASMVFVVCRADPNKPLFGFPLPTSARFTGRQGGHECVESFEISRLHGASIEKGGTVELADGTRLQAVNVVPLPLSWELTELQKRIVYWTLKLIGAEAKCYRGPATEDLAYLDYGTLHGLEIPTLEKVGAYVRAQDWTLRRLSRQTIANALAACGVRVPGEGSFIAPQTPPLPQFKWRSNWSKVAETSAS